MLTPRYLSHSLLDFLLESRKLKNDAALCRLLDIQPPVISKVRHGRPVSPELILRIHEKLGMPVAEIRALIPRREPLLPDRRKL
jgi:hypothetical protein